MLGLIREVMPVWLFNERSQPGERDPFQEETHRNWDCWTLWREIPRQLPPHL